MADDKKNIPKKVPPAEASAPTVENVAMLEPPIPESALTDAGAVMLEHEGQQSSLSLSQAQKMRELEKYFGKDKSPREMKDKIISLLDDWKAKQPPELGKPEKKTELEK